MSTVYARRRLVYYIILIYYFMLDVRGVMGVPSSNTGRVRSQIPKIICMNLFRFRHLYLK